MAMTPQGVARIFTLLGLPVPNAERLARIAGDGRSATQIRDDLLEWGRGQGGEVLQNMYRNLVDSRFEAQGISDPAAGGESGEERINRIAQQLASGERTLEDFDSALTKATGGRSGERDREANEDDEPLLNILNSPHREILHDKKTGLYYARYRLPGTTDQFVLFEIEPEQFKTLGLETTGTINFEQAIRRNNQHMGGNIAEMEGTGSWEEESRRQISLALDQGDLPEWIRDDPEALALLYVKFTEERSDDWFYSQLARLGSFKKRYPGVATLTGRGLTVPEAVQAHTEFEAQLKTLQATVGLPEAAIKPEHVGGLLAKGYNIETVTESYKAWSRMRDHAPALKAFNQVLKANGMQPLAGNKMYQFLMGNAPKEVYDLYEASAIREAASASGLGSVFSAGEALSFATETTQDLTVDQAYAGFSKAAADALRLRHELNVSKFGIEIDELIDLSFGRKPRSGRSAAEVGEILSRITAGAQAALQGQVGAFTGFSPTGAPQQPGLSRLRQQQ